MNRTVGINLSKRFPLVRSLVTQVNSNFVSPPLLPVPVIPESSQLITYEQQSQLVSAIILLQEEENRLDQSLNLYLEQLSQTEPMKTRKRKSQRKGISDNQHNLHKLREKLRNELPQLFWPNYIDHDFSIYDESIQLKIFKRDTKPLVIKGLTSYKLAYQTSKQKVLIEMKSPQMEIMDSSIDMKMGQVQFKWRILGDSKLNYTLGRILPINSRPNEIRMISTFKINESGDVMQHVISDMEITKGYQWTRASSMAFIFGAFGARNGVPPPAFGEDSFLGY